MDSPLLDSTSLFSTLTGFDIKANDPDFDLVFRFCVSYFLFHSGDLSTTLKMKKENCDQLENFIMIFC